MCALPGEILKRDQRDLQRSICFNIVTWSKLEPDANLTLGLKIHSLFYRQAFSNGSRDMKIGTFASQSCHTICERYLFQFNRTELPRQEQTRIIAILKLDFFNCYPMLGDTCPSQKDHHTF